MHAVKTTQQNAQVTKTKTLHAGVNFFLVLAENKENESFKILGNSAALTGYTHTCTYEHIHALLTATRNHMIYFLFLSINRSASSVVFCDISLAP